MTEVPYDGPSPAPSKTRVRSKAKKLVTNKVENCTRDQVAASRARILFVPAVSVHAVTTTDESANNQKKLPPNRPYRAGLRWNSLMIGIAARPSTALSAKLTHGMCNEMKRAE